MDTNVLSDRFKRFAIRECKGSSRLYEQLSLEIAEDEELLRIAAFSRHGQPIPNLFFAAVHYLLLKGKHHELKEYYGSMVQDPKDPSMAFPYFKDFCLRHQDEMIPILENKLVQTNEVRRCAYLYPSFCYIYEKTRRPLALIEIGTSSGLQLLWDKYCYSYGSDDRYGNVFSELHIHSEIRGARDPFFLRDSPPVAARIGIDLHINDLSDHEDFLWLKSLIWPEHSERMANLENAADCLKGQALEFVEGNAVKLITEIAAKIPGEMVLCVFHTHVANQFSDDDKYELMESIHKLGGTRDVFHLYNNMWDSHLHLDYYLNRELHKLTLAETDGHGRWFQWLL